MKIFSEVLDLEKQMFDLKKRDQNGGNFEEFSLNIITFNQEFKKKVKDVLKKPDIGFILNTEIGNNKNLTKDTTITPKNIDNELEKNWKPGKSNL